MPEAKEKTAGVLRQPKAKHKLGLRVPAALRLPHDDLIRPQETRLTDSSTGDSTPTPGPPPAQAHPEPTPGPVAPLRDFYRRPNSLERDAVPAGLFPGGTKHTYDALYQRTRGAVTPVRSIQATKRQLMLWADVSNEKTIESHIKHLVGVGLFRRTGSLGDNKGQFYEVMTPEELGLLLPPGPPPAQAQPIPTSGQKLAPPQAQKLPPGGLGEVEENTDTSSPPKTSFKTNTERSDDDEAFRRLFAVAKEITGREVPTAQWREVVDVLVAELRIAAARTTVSSAPAFLAEHLRRRLWKIDKKQARAEGRELPDEAATAAPPKDTAGCPDCNGSGWWYPEGPEKGVAKCKHAKLGRSEAGK